VIAPAKPRPRPATSVGKRVTLYASHLVVFSLLTLLLLPFNNSLGTAPIPVAIMTEAEAIPVEVVVVVVEAALRNATAAAK
jgi:hypothetical protein